MIQAIKGTRDILPQEAGKWQFAEATARRLFRRHGFREIRTPIFESTELFARGIGGATDIVSKEMYTFQDRGGRSLTLRPENTAGVVRAAIEHALFQQPPCERLYYIGPMFRYDRPQKGRMRQFHQIGVEVFGGLDPFLDAEIIQMASALLHDLGISGSDLVVNSVGCEVCRPAYRDRLREFLAPRQSELCADCQKRYAENPLRILDCKAGCRRFLEGSPTLLDSLDPACRDHFQAVRRFLHLLEIPHRVDPYLVRGLDYYVRTTFEILGSTLGAQNALLGGGRYDGLVHDLGGPEVAGIGFASGLERLILSLPEASAEAGERPEFFIAVHGPAALEAGLKLARDLRQRGAWVEQDPNPARSLKAQSRRADQLRSKRILFLGDEEIRRGVLTVKDLATGDQREVPAAEWNRLIPEGSDG